MSNRYRVEVTVGGSYDPTPAYRVLDYCVKPGELPKRLSVGSDAIGAINFAQKLNKEDDAAKAAFDARELETVSIQANRGTTFSMDVETHAKRYFIGANGLAVYGSHEAIDHLRGKLNCRYRQIMDLGHINKNLRANLKDAQQAADKFKCDLASTEKRYADACYQLDSIRRATLTGRYTSESIVEYIGRIEGLATKTAGQSSNYWKDQYDIVRIELEALRKRISEL